jgi:hypothetical protein
MARNECPRQPLAGVISATSIYDALSQLIINSHGASRAYVGLVASAPRYLYTPLFARVLHFTPLLHHSTPLNRRRIGGRRISSS